MRIVGVEPGPAFWQLFLPWLRTTGSLPITLTRSPVVNVVAPPANLTLTPLRVKVPLVPLAQWLVWATVTTSVPDQVVAPLSCVIDVPSATVPATMYATLCGAHRCEGWAFPLGWLEPLGCAAAGTAIASAPAAATSVTALNLILIRCLLGATGRPGEATPGPWFCAPASRRVCLSQLR